MKVSKIFIIYIIFLHLLAGYALYRSDLIKSPFPTEDASTLASPSILYNSTIDLLAELDTHAPDKEIAFLGDSITQGLPVGIISPDTINLGIGSDTSKGLLNRISSYKSLVGGKAIVLLIGINDLASNSGDVSSFSDLLKAVPSNVPLYWYAIFPIDNNVNKRTTNKQILELNMKLKDQCETHPNCKFIDLTSQLVDRTGNLNPNFHVGDGIHLSSQGYKIWIDDLKFRLQ